MNTGLVQLVGAGPGDPELITIKGVRALQRADSILYDNLATARLLQHARPDAERLYVGKKRSHHAYTQREICDMLLERARRGLRVVRLKGGDPLIFGRGGEEIETLARAEVPFEIIPGVTSALGIAACCGIPLTHREHSSSLTFITGHTPERVNWDAAVHADTLVVFMGIQHIDDIARELIRRGRPAATPAIAVRWGTRPDQRSVAGTLGTISDLVHQHGLAPPATVLIGEVVRFHEQLGWFEKRPLFGQQVVVTRARAQAGELTEMLETLGAEVCELPAIELRPVEDAGAIDAAIGRLDQYDWLIFTSTNACDFFFARLAELGRDARAIRGRICAIGTGTAAALSSRYLKADLVPSEAIAEGVVEAFAGIDVKGARILLPRAAEAREVIPEALRARRAQVDVVDVYRNVLPEAAAAAAARIFGNGRRPDWITFTSSSTVKNTLAVAPAGALDGVRIASIGPATSKTVRMHGLEVAAEAQPSNLQGLVDAILNSL